MNSTISSWFWQFPAPPHLWLWPLLLLMMAVLLLLPWWRTGSVRASDIRRTLLAVGAWVMLANPYRTQSAQTNIPSQLRILVDDSCSMQRRHSDGKNAHAQAVAWLHDNDAALRQAAQNQSLQQSGLSMQPLPASDLQACGPDTDLLPAILRLARTPGPAVAAVVLLSDGIDTHRQTSPAALTPLEQQQLGKLPFAVHVVDLGAPAADAQILAVRHDDFAFVKTTSRIEVDVRSVQMSARWTQVSLYNGQQLLGQKSVQLTPEKVETVHFDVRPQQVETSLYTVALDVQPEETLIENNSQSFVLQVLRDKIRVLHVVGRPSFDARFVRQALRSSSNVDLISFYILRTPDNEAVIREDELSLIPFPVARLFTTELKNFDVVVLQDFDYRPFAMGQYLPNLAQAVREGLGLAMLGGSGSFAAGGYAQSPLAEILPTEQLHAPMLPLAGAGTPVVAQQALAAHPLLQRAAEGARLPIWPKLTQGWLNPLGAPLGQAQVLLYAEHEQQRLPLLAARDVHKGRSMAWATDGSWRWAFTDDEQGQQGSAAHAALWHNALHWLAHDEPEPRLRLVPQARQHTPLAPVSGTARVLLPSFAAAADAQIAVRLSPMPALPQETHAKKRAQTPAGMQQLLRTGADGSVQWQFDAVAPGRYWLEAKADADGPLTTQLPIVVAPYAEDLLAQPEPGFLASIAQASDGLVLPQRMHAAGPNFAPQRHLPRAHQLLLPVWPNRWLLWAWLAALVGHWYLSRREDLPG